MARSTAAIRSCGIHIGNADSLDVKIPLICVGDDLKKKVVVLCGVHGNERSGLWIVNRLLSEIMSDPVAGAVMLIPAANPLASALSSRVDPIAYLDINRIFPGKAEGNLSERVAWALSSLILGNDVKSVKSIMDFQISNIADEEHGPVDLEFFESAIGERSLCVIDLHTFGLQKSLITGVLTRVPFGTSSVVDEADRVSRDLVKLFDPEIIWELNCQSGFDKEYASSLSPFLLGRGVPNFAVETREMPLIEPGDVKRVVDGILRVLGPHGLKILERFGCHDTQLVASKRKIPVYRRYRQRARMSGIFLPKEEYFEGGIGKPVSLGTCIGEMVATPTLRGIPIEADWRGDSKLETLDLMMLHRGFVVTGEELCSWGERLDHL